MATYPRDRVADVVIDGGTPYEARLQDDRPPRRSCLVHHRPAALQKLATWAVLVGCPRQRRTARSMSAMPGRGPPMSKPVQHAAIARSHRSGLLCAFCPAHLLTHLQQIFGVRSPLARLTTMWSITSRD